MQEISIDHTAQLDLKDDQTLIARLRARDQMALSQLYDQYSSAVYALARRITGHAADAEEVVADSFWQVWQQADRYDAVRGSLAAWLFVIARTRAIDRRRAQSKLPAGKCVEYDSNLPPDLLSAADPEREADHMQMAARLQAALSHLPAPQREVLVLAFYCGFSHTEIAAQLDQPIGTVKTRIRLGLQKMRERVATEFASFDAAAEQAAA